MMIPQTQDLKKDFHFFAQSFSSFVLRKFFEETVTASLDRLSDHRDEWACSAAVPQCFTNKNFFCANTQTTDTKSKFRCFVIPCSRLSSWVPRCPSRCRWAPNKTFPEITTVMKESLPLPVPRMRILLIIICSSWPIWRGQESSLTMISFLPPETRYTQPSLS